MNDKTRTSISKFLSYVLRHEPSAAGVTLDAEGWVDVDSLLAGCAAHGKRLSRTQLEEVVARCPKQRFAFSDDGARIRASQGHSAQVDLGYAPADPPPVLFHGTVERFLPAIREQGLLKMKRHHVHLSADEATARNVGGRRGKPVLLRIDTAAMRAAGHAFFLSANGVWLTETVPPEFIDGLAQNAQSEDDGLPHE